MDQAMITATYPAVTCTNPRLTLHDHEPHHDHGDLSAPPLGPFMEIASQRQQVNVVVAHTLRMSAAVLKAGRPHQVLLPSGTTHMPDDADVVTQLLRHELAFLTESLGAPAL